MTSRIGSNQPAPRRTGTTGALPQAPARPQPPRPAAPTDRARLGVTGDLTLQRNLPAAAPTSNDDLLNRALAAMGRPVNPFRERMQAALPAVRAAALASGVARPVGLLPRLAQGLRNGISRGIERFGSFVRSIPEQVRNAANYVKNRASDLASFVYNSPAGAPLRLLASGAQFVRRELGFNQLPVQETEDPVSPNRPDAGADATARQQLADPARQQQAQQALQALPETQRQAYTTMFGSLGNSPRAQAALQDLAIRGRLAERDLSGGRSLMENLTALANQPVAEGVNREQLVAEVVQEIANPVSIEQKSRNTCGATTAQIYLANSNGAEYARLVAGLASPEGRATLQDGTEMQRDPNWNADIDGGRTTSSRLLQPAFMDVASFGDYQNSSDTHEMLGTSWGYPGVMPGRMRNLMESMTGRDFTLDFGRPSGDTLRSATRENPVPIVMNYNREEGSVLSPHWLQVTGYRPDTQQLEVINPWGSRELISETEIHRRLIASVPRND